jgi:hypothetical protein
MGYSRERLTKEIMDGFHRKRHTTPSSSDGGFANETIAIGNLRLKKFSLSVAEFLMFLLAAYFVVRFFNMGFIMHVGLLAVASPLVLGKTSVYTLYLDICNRLVEKVRQRRVR